jgi:hypothetical protein
MKRRNDSLFGVCDFYSRNFIGHGHEAVEVHVNNPWMQSAWAREHGLRPVPIPADQHSPDRPTVSRLKRALRPYRDLLAPIAKLVGAIPSLDAGSRAIVLAQIEEFRPDVILNQDLFMIDTALVRQMQQKGRCLIAWCGVDPPSAMNYSVYTFALSMLDWVIEHFRAHGLSAEKSHLGFEHTLSDRLGQLPERDVAVSFVGSLSAIHAKRIALLEAIAAKCPLDFWAPSISALSANSPLRACYRGEAYGRSVYEIMRRSLISLNTHADSAHGQASNMRLFETTGMGALLLTDNEGKLSDLFEPNKEAVGYDTVGGAVAKIERYLRDQSEREAIARAGQARTLKAHSYRERTAQILCYIEKYAN